MNNTEAGPKPLKRKSVRTPLILGGVVVLLGVMVAAVVWWPPRGESPGPDESTPGSSRAPYREIADIERLCVKLDWAAVDEIAKLEDPIEAASEIDPIGQDGGDTWDATCKASDDPSEGEVYALVGVAVQDTTAQAEKAYAQLKKFPVLPIGSRDSLDCSDDDAKLWQETDSCRSTHASALYLGLQRLARDDNLVVVTGMIYGGGRLDDVTSDDQREALLDDMSSAAADLAVQARELIGENS